MIGKRRIKGPTTYGEADALYNQMMTDDALVARVKEIRDGTDETHKQAINLFIGNGNGGNQPETPLPPNLLALGSDVASILEKGQTTRQKTFDKLAGQPA